MSTLIEYRGLKVLDPEPTGPGGLALQNDLKLLADRLAATRYVSGLRLRRVGAGELRVEPGQALSADGTLDLVVTRPLTVVLGTSGVGGVDAGTIGPGIWYVHLVGDAADALPVGALLSRSLALPSLPVGYDRHRRIGAVAVAASSLLAFHQAGAGLDRTIYYAIAQQQSRVLHNGSSPVMVAVDCRALVPDTAHVVLLRARLRIPGRATGKARFRAGGDAHNGSLYTVRGADSVVHQLQLPCPGGVFEYSVEDPSQELSVSVVGFQDEL